MAKANEEEPLEREVYLEERKMLVHLEETMSVSFGKYMLTLSSGAFGLSILFIKQIAPSPIYTCWLIVSWSFFILSMLTIILSLLGSQHSMQKACQILDRRLSPPSEIKQNKQSDRNCWNVAVTVLNWASFAFFILGSFFIMSFAIKNI